MTLQKMQSALNLFAADDINGSISANREGKIVIEPRSQPSWQTHLALLNMGFELKHGCYIYSR